MTWMRVIEYSRAFISALLKLLGVTFCESSFPGSGAARVKSPHAQKTENEIGGLSPIRIQTVIRSKYRDNT
jgi:hypothetical protein